MQSLRLRVSRSLQRARVPLDLLLGWLRRQFRANDLWFISLAAVVGLIAAVLTVLQAGLAHTLQTWLYGLAPGERLSTADGIGVQPADIGAGWPGTRC